MTITETLAFVDQKKVANVTLLSFRKKSKFKWKVIILPQSKASRIKTAKMFQSLQKNKIQ